MGISSPSHYDWELDYKRWRHQYSEQLDAVTFCHAGVGVIERKEVINPAPPLSEQRANFLARYPDKLEYFRNRSVTAIHFYDLDWTLLTIDASPQWPAVVQRAEAAGVKLYDGDGEVYRRFEAYERAGEPAPTFRCADRVPRPFPTPTYPPPPE